MLTHLIITLQLEMHKSASLFGRKSISVLVRRKRDHFITSGQVNLSQALDSVLTGN